MEITKENYEAYYNSYHYPHVDNFNKDGGHYHRTVFYTEFIKKGDRVLDAGCSNGGLLKYLYENGFTDLYGIDISEKCVEMAKTVCPVARVTKCNIESMFFPDGYFDIVIAGEVLEHVWDLHKALNELKRVLKIGGKLLISVPAGKDDNVEHLRFLTEKEWRMLGFTIFITNPYSLLGLYFKGA